MLFTGMANADERLSACSNNCADEFKACRKQADIASLTETNPAIVDGSNMRASRHMPTSGSDAAMKDAENTEATRRRAERNQQCEVQQQNCATRCTENNPPKRSVIFK